jgi:hypothetical protein
MKNNILYMRRLQMLIDKMIHEKDMDLRKVTYAGLKAVVIEMNAAYRGNVHFHERSFELLENLKWLAHIHDPGYGDDFYIKNINSALKELHAPSGIILKNDASGQANGKNRFIDLENYTS